MKHKLKAFLAVSMLASMLFMFAFSVMPKMSQNIYNFDTAESFPYISTDYAQYALTEDGTLLKRTVFGAFSYDSLVKHIGNIVVHIPLDGDAIKNILKNILSFDVSLLSLGGAIKSSASSVFITFSILFLMVLLGAGDWNFFHMRSLLLSKAQSQNGGGYTFYYLRNHLKA